MAKICVVGAGNMGAGIAQRCAQSGFSVSMVDIKDEFVKKGFDSIRRTLEDGVKRGKLKPDQVDAVINNIHGTIDLAAAAADADMVIEAVFEDIEVKKKLFADLDKACKPEAILATNTSSLSVNEMAAVTARPAKFAGLHFFYPAAINQLIEVIPGDKTAPETVSKLVDVSRLLGKLPILVKDAPGFAVNRYFVPFLNEACKMLDEGVADMATIEDAAKKTLQIGMGPFELMNATGVVIAYHAQESLHKALGSFYKPAASLKKQLESGQKWKVEGSPDQSKSDEIGERFLGMLFCVALHLVEEGVATKEAVERGATVGLRWKSGPFAMMNEIGVERSLDIVRKYRVRVVPEGARGPGEAGGVKEAMVPPERPDVQGGGPRRHHDRQAGVAQRPQLESPRRPQRSDFRCGRGRVGQGRDGHGRGERLRGGGRHQGDDSQDPHGGQDVHPAGPDGVQEA